MSDLVLFNATTQSAVHFAASATVSYDSASRSATWVFSHPIPDGDLRMDQTSICEPVAADELARCSDERILLTKRLVRRKIDVHPGRIREKFSHFVPRLSP
jgi:hypothetical protein